MAEPVSGEIKIKILTEGGDAGGSAGEPTSTAAASGRGKANKATIDSVAILKKVAGLLGIAGGIGMLVKNSKVMTTVIGSFFQLFGAVIDMLLMPLMPVFMAIMDAIVPLIPIIGQIADKIISPLVNWLVPGIQLVAERVLSVVNKLPDTWDWQAIGRAIVEGILGKPVEEVLGATGEPKIAPWGETYYVLPGVKGKTEEEKGWLDKFNDWIDNLARKTSWQPDWWPEWLKTPRNPGGIFFEPPPGWEPPTPPGWESFTPSPPLPGELQNPIKQLGGFISKTGWYKLHRGEEVMMGAGRTTNNMPIVVNNSFDMNITPTTNIDALVSSISRNVTDSLESALRRSR